MSIISILANPRILGAIAVAGITWLAWSHYTGLRADLSAARSNLAAMTTRAESAEQIARDNAAAVLRADEDRRTAVAALEDAQIRISSMARVSRDADVAVRSAPDDDDGPVAPLLEALRERRFR